VNRYQRRNLRTVKRVSTVEMAVVDLSESDELRDIRQLCKALGLEMDVYSDYRKSRLEPGHPDRRVYVRRKKLAFWWEGKATDGKLSDDQVKWLERAAACGDLCGWGGYSDFYDFLVELGVIGNTDVTVLEPRTVNGEGD